MTALDKRREEDVRRIQTLCARSSGKLHLADVSGTPPNRIRLHLLFRTAHSRSYPASAGQKTTLTITLPSEYPLQGPKAELDPIVYHPNVYSSGLICLGSKWMATENLDLLVKRIIKIVTFDPTILNVRSPANREAVDWYNRAIASNHAAFPTDVFEYQEEGPKKKMVWTNAAQQTEPEKILAACQHCGQQLRLPAGRSGVVKCPKCGQRFAVTGS